MLRPPVAQCAGNSLRQARLIRAGCRLKLASVASPRSCGGPMRNRMSVPADSADVYLVEDDFGRHGVAYVETDKADADRETIVGNFLSGQYSRPLRVIAFNVDEGSCREVSEDIAVEVLQRATATETDFSTPLSSCAFTQLDRQDRRSSDRPL
jgi:hypothetical protein